jgi:DNA-3-methyladenine glycosylase II
METHPLRAHAPFDFQKTLSFFDMFSPMAGEQRIARAPARRPRLVKAFDTGGTPFVAEVGEHGPDTLACSLHGGPGLDVAPALDRVSFVLSLDDDLGPFHDKARADPAFAPVLAELAGLHHVKFPSAFENAVWAVLGQRTPMRLAHAVKRAFVARFGPSVPIEGGEPMLAFPSAERVLAAGPDAVLEVVRHRVKAEAISAIAHAFAGVDEAWLRAGPYEEVRAWLSDLPRMGPWSTHFVLFRGLGRMDDLDLDGDALQRCLRAVYGPRADARKLAAHYGRDAGYWVYYLRCHGERPAASRAA